MDFTSRPKTIFRNASPRRNYTQICNDMLQDYELSLDATGFLARMLSLPPQWDFCKAWAEDKFQVGEKKLERILKETALHGYSKFDQFRNSDGTHGKVVYSFTDVPWTFDDGDRDPKSDPAVNIDRSPINGAPVERGRRKGSPIKDSPVRKEISLKNNNLSKSESCSSGPCKKYATQLSEGAAATVEEDFREFAMGIKSLDVNSLLAGGVLYNPKGYAKLGELMDKFGAPVFEQAVREILAREKCDGKMRRGGIRCWSYFAGQAADIAKKQARGGMPIVDECRF